MLSWTAAVPNFVYLQAAGSVIILCVFIIASTRLQQKAVDKTLGVLGTTSDQVKTTELYKTVFRHGISTPFSG